MTADLSISLPCGCRRELVKRQAPALNEDGTPKWDNGFVMEEVEEIQEVFCDTHTIAMINRQHEVKKALAGGTITSDEALRLTGVASHPLLGDGSGDDGSGNHE